MGGGTLPQSPPPAVRGQIARLHAQRSCPLLATTTSTQNENFAGNFLRHSRGTASFLFALSFCSWLGVEE